MECDIQKPKTIEKTTMRHVEAICDMSHHVRCRFPHCAPADDHPILEPICFQTGKRPQGVWPPRAGAAIFDVCSLAGVAHMRHGMVYAIGAETSGPLKIGMATDLAKRRDQLQVGNWRQLLILGARYCGKRTAAAAAESWMHHRFAGARIGSGKGGEWFDIRISDFEAAAREYFYG